MNASYIIMSASSAATDAHGGDHASGVFPPLDPSTFPSQLFWLFITFGFLLFFLAKVLLPRLSSILEERSNTIADDLDVAARMQRDAEAAEKAYETSLKDARAKAHNVAETTKASVNAEIETEMEAADADAAVQLAAAETKIQAMRQKALSNVDDIAADAAAAMTERLFGGKITAAAARKAVKALG